MADNKATQERIDVAMEQAKEAMKANNFALAIKQLEDLVTQSPEEHEAWYFLAVCQRYTQQAEAASRSLQKCLEIDPSFGRAYQEFGHLHLAQGRIQDAIGAYLDAVRRNDSLVATWRQLIDLANRVGDLNLRKDAEEQYRRLNALPGALLGVRNFLAEGKLLKAESLCRAFLKQNPKHVEGMRLLADIGVKLSILDDAEFLLESALVFEPEIPLHALITLTSYTSGKNTRSP